MLLTTGAGLPNRARCRRPLNFPAPGRSSAVNSLCRFAFGWSALARKRLLDACRALGIRRFEAVKESVRTSFKELRQPREGGQRNGKIAAFDVADCFPMHTDQLSQTLLGQVGFQPRVTNVLADHSEHLLICHTPSWNGYAPLLTPRIHSVNNSPLSERKPVVDGEDGRCPRTAPAYNLGKLLVEALYRLQLSQFLLPHATEAPQGAHKLESRRYIFQSNRQLGKCNEPLSKRPAMNRAATAVVRPFGSGAPLVSLRGLRCCRANVRLGPFLSYPLDYPAHKN